MIQFPDITLGEVEIAVLEELWTQGPLNPGAVHERVGKPRGISINTVSSALKRLYQKALLEREKVSHAYVYRAAVTRSDLQRHLIGEITAQFSGETGASFLAAFVDLAEGQGEATLRRLEQMVADRLAGGDE
jgi:predicted transcriptional regulator